MSKRYVVALTEAQLKTLRYSYRSADERTDARASAADAKNIGAIERQIEGGFLWTEKDAIIRLALHLAADGDDK